jgi:hypothetical protein
VNRTRAHKGDLVILHQAGPLSDQEYDALMKRWGETVGADHRLVVCENPVTVLPRRSRVARRGYTPRWAR